MGKKIRIINRLDGELRRSLTRDVKTGLSAGNKHLPCKYFYDHRGSLLFEDICRLPEYYLTRAELCILERAAPALMECKYHVDLVEMGSGANWKIKVLLDAAGSKQRETLRYVPVDVCKEELSEAAHGLLDHFPGLPVLGVVSDFTRHMDAIPDGRKRMMIFFGSTLGNFSEPEAREFLRDVADSMNPGDSFILGLDMVKRVEVMERAYNDAQGVTREFNRNVLRVINSELDADFEPEGFAHLAFYNHEYERVEMHLMALKDMEVRIGVLGSTVNFREGETIHTENCRKFSEERIKSMTEETGFSIERWFTEEEHRYSLLELSVQ